MDILISGASTGIGRAIGIHMARLGHSVWAGVRNQHSFDDLMKMNVRGLNPLFLDVTDPTSIAEFVSQVKKKSGMVHALVNNAGVVVGGPIESLTLADWRAQFDVNFFGLIELTRVCLPLLREAKGRIVNISSISGRVANPYMAPYSASKFALEAFSDSLRRELRKTGVRVAVIEPGAINTPIWRKSLTAKDAFKARLSPELLDVYGRSLDKFLVALEKVEHDAAPVSVVITAVEHALLSLHPKIRYPVGRGIRTIAWLSGVIPDTWMDRLMGLRL